MRHTSLCAGLWLGASAMAASAATLDFTEVGQTGIVASTVISLSNATITTFGDDTFIGAPGQFGEANNLGIICASPTGSDNCEEDMEIAFDGPIENLTFASFGVSRGDLVEVTGFLDGAEVGSQVITTATAIDFSAFGAIDTLFFADASNAAGIGFGDFSFDVVIAPIPLPAGMPLTVAALGAFAFMARRRTQ